MARHRHFFPEEESWARSQDWTWLTHLPPSLHSTARFICFTCQKLYVAGTIDQLHLNDDPDHLIAAAIQDAGLI